VYKNVAVFQDVLSKDAM